MLENTYNPEPLQESDQRAQDIFKYMENIAAAAGFSTKY
jgi:hypothetical protein